jgi:NitT/TauT family transport system substrate-binding protein
VQVAFIPQWLPQAQFAGYYVASEKGFYRQQGLAVDILRGGPERPVTEALQQGMAQFGTMFLATAIHQRANGIKLVNIGQVVQRSAFMLAARKAGGIATPQDLQGKKVGLWGAEFGIQAQAFFRKYQVTVRPVPQASTLNLFLLGGVEAASAMWYNEYYQLINAGLDPEELTTFRLADYGVNFPEDGIYCLEDTFRSHPQLCHRFVAASLQGWQYAFEHPQEALNIVMGYVTRAHAATNRVHQQWMLARMQDIIQPPGTSVPLGSLSLSTYLWVAETLKDYGMIKTVPPFVDFFQGPGGQHAP